MKKYIKYLVCMVILFSPLMSYGKVTCNNGEYSATIDIGKNKLSIGESTNFLIISDYDYNVTYEASNNKIISINDEGLVTALDVGSSTIKTNIEFIHEDTPVYCSATLDIQVLSSDSSLKSLNLEEIDISTVFKSDTYEYVVSVPYNYEKINIVAVPNDSEATVVGDGRKYLNELVNEFEIVVKATDDTTTTYKLLINKETASSDNTLKNLYVEGYVFDQLFSSDTFDYSMSVDKSVESIKIGAQANHEQASIVGLGEFKLASGINTFKVTVLAEDATKLVYKITVNKSKGSAKLADLLIKDYKLDEKFSSDKYIYNVVVKSDVNALEINPKTTNNELVEIIGNENLIEGNNTILIKVTNDEGATTYKLLVNKLSLSEQEQLEKNDLLLKGLLIIFIISLIVMVTFVIIFLKRNYIKKKDKNKLKKRKIVKNG